ncbi:MAG TPA: YciI family protein [Vicinamibacterales bacterium]|jgi:hypothetical protein|nr:YciI family protein [Vicinamibacterales bacterium]
MNDQDDRPLSDADVRRLRTTPVPPPDLQERTVAAVFGRRTKFGALNLTAFVAVLAALTIVPVVIAFGLGRAMTQRAPDLSGAYLLLIESTPGESPLAPDAVAARVREYAEWAHQLREKNLLVSAEKLDDGEVVLPTGSTAPLAAGDERIGGFFIVRAADVGAALSIARESPHIRHGGRIVVRRIASGAR